MLLRHILFQDQALSGRGPETDMHSRCKGSLGTSSAITSYGFQGNFISTTLIWCFTNIIITIRYEELRAGSYAMIPVYIIKLDIPPYRRSY